MKNDEKFTKNENTKTHKNKINKNTKTKNNSLSRYINTHTIRATSSDLNVHECFQEKYGHRSEGLYINYIIITIDDAFKLSMPK